MNHFDPTIPGLAALMLAATVASQEQLLTSSAHPADGWRVPIHSHAPDPAGGRYGVWAAGPDYKASFHDGFVFYPCLGPSYPANLPLRWTTESIAAGGAPLVDLSRAAHAHGEWRYEYCYEGVTEAYDVRADGVEQTFVVQRRPERAGDLTIVGRVDTNLRPLPALASPCQQDLLFADAQDRPIVRYGKALAFDAHRRSVPVTTALDGTRIRLTVPGDWLASAVFPVTVDPLTARVGISFNGPPRNPAIACESESQTWKTLLAYPRQFSATDLDLYVRLANGNLTSSSQVFTDIAADWSTDAPDACYVGGADRWVITFFRHFTTGATRVRAHFHDRENLTLNSGLTAYHDFAPAEHHTFPAVGGSASRGTGTTALLTYRADAAFANTDRSVVWGLLVDAVSRTLGVRFQISRPNLDAEAPDVNGARGANDGQWMVVYSGRNWNSSTDDYDVYVARVTSSGAVAGDVFVGPDAGADKGWPVVDGRDGRYLVAMIGGMTGEWAGTTVLVERFDWFASQPAPRKLGPHTRASASNVGHVQLAFDHDSASHWALAYQFDAGASTRSIVLRMGYSGGVTETAPLNGGQGGTLMPAVAYNSHARAFPLLYCGGEASAPVYGQILEHPAAAVNTPFGTACQSTTNSLLATPPFAGSQFFQLTFLGRPNGTSCVLLLALGSASVPLDFIGMPGCTYYVSPLPGLHLLSVPLAVSGSAATFRLALPDAPVFRSDLFGQMAWVEPGLNPAGLGMSHGLRMSVR
jgi:hypothetical protein